MSIAPNATVIRVGRGRSATFTVTVRDWRRRPVINAFTGLEPLELEICDLTGLAIEGLASSVAWLDPAAGTVSLAIDEADTETMAAGNRGISITATVGGKQLELFCGTLRVEPRALLAVSDD